MTKTWLPPALRHTRDLSRRVVSFYRALSLSTSLKPAWHSGLVQRGSQFTLAADRLSLRLPSAPNVRSTDRPNERERHGIHTRRGRERGGQGQIDHLQSVQGRADFLRP